MQKLFLSALLLFTTTFVFAQRVKQNDVPQVVKDVLYKMYPNAKVSEWEMEDGNYEAEFENNDVETSVVISPAGVLVMTEVEIATAELPVAVIDYMNKNHAGQKITEACKITTSAGVISYEAEAGGDDYLFDSEGNYTGKEVEEKDDKDDKDED